jgi:hypothetical protein
MMLVISLSLSASGSFGQLSEAFEVGVGMG